MKQSKKSLNYFLSILFACSLLLLSNCGTEGEADPQDQFVGTWSLDQTNVDFTVDGKSLEQFLLDDGATADEVQQAQELLLAFIEDEFGTEGEIKLNADNTYSATFGSDTDTGTWAYNDATGILTINSNDGQQDIDVKSITPSTLIIAIEEILIGDINDDGTDEDILLYMEQNYTKL